MLNSTSFYTSMVVKIVILGPYDYNRSRRQKKMMEIESIFLKSRRSLGKGAPCAVQLKVPVVEWFGLRRSKGKPSCLYSHPSALGRKASASAESVVFGLLRFTTAESASPLERV